MRNVARPQPLFSIPAFSHANSHRSWADQVDQTIYNTHSATNEETFMATDEALIDLNTNSSDGISLGDEDVDDDERDCHEEEVCEPIATRPEIRKVFCAGFLP